MFTAKTTIALAAALSSASLTGTTINMLFMKMEMCYAMLFRYNADVFSLIDIILTDFDIFESASNIMVS